MTDPQKTVLVVDNDEDWLSLLERLLVSEGYRVLKAQNCAAAIKLDAQERLHCVIADLKIGAEDGMAVCCAIKRSPELKHVPVIMLSGAEQPETNCGCSCDAFVCKADGTTLLLKAVRKALTP